MTGAPSAGVTAAGSEALRQLEQCIRQVVVAAVGQHSPQNGDAAAGIGAWHDGVARTLHNVSMDHGSEAMLTASAYAVAALDAGMLYPGQELDEFITKIGASVRATARDVSKGTPVKA